MIYFDNGVGWFFTKPHSDKTLQDQVDKIILTINNVCGIDLEQGFNHVWTPGWFLERTSKGKKYLTEIVKRTYNDNLKMLTTKDKLISFLEQLKEKISTHTVEVLKEDPIPEDLPLDEKGLAGIDLLNFMFSFYNKEQRFLRIQTYLEAEAMQQILMDVRNVDFRKEIFHSCIVGFLKQYFENKQDINLSRLILDYVSISKGVYKNKKERLIDPNKDLGDGEMMHLTICGTWENNDLVPVTGVTFDDSEKLRPRLISAKSVLFWAIANSEHPQHVHPGKVICIDRKADKTTLIDVGDLDLEQWVYDESSEKALVFLEKMHPKKIYNLK
jgi:hypothetical protein